jgi:hypothetical protein
MGERTAIQGSIVCSQAHNTYFGIDDYLLITNNIACLRSFCAGNLIYVHNNAGSYYKCEFDPALEAVLMIESKRITGDVSHAS